MTLGWISLSDFLLQIQGGPPGSRFDLYKCGRFYIPIHQLNAVFVCLVNWFYIINTRMLSPSTHLHSITYSTCFLWCVVFISCVFVRKCCSWNTRLCSFQVFWQTGFQHVPQGLSNLTSQIFHRHSLLYTKVSSIQGRVRESVLPRNITKRKKNAVWKHILHEWCHGGRLVSKG